MLAKLGDRVRIRIGNLSAMDHHPIHLHGHAMKVIETDGGPIPEAGQWPETTVLVPVGTTRTVEFIANNPGDWAMHCHMTHHVMNQMGHGLPNIIGINPEQLDEKVRTFLPGYMTMGQDGRGKERKNPPNHGGHTSDGGDKTKKCGGPRGTKPRREGPGDKTHPQPQEEHPQAQPNPRNPPKRWARVKVLS